MLSILPALTLRLQSIPALAGWDVRNNIEPANRSALPAADVRCTRARVADRKTGAVMLSPEWTVTLVLRRAADAAAVLDEALAAVLAQLQGWSPGQHGGRGWERLSLLDVSEPDFFDEGLAGYTLTFGTAAMYRGEEQQ